MTLDNPNSYELTLRLSGRGLQYAAVAMSEDNSLISKEFEPEVRVESAVYDDPVLTVDFKHVNFVIVPEKTLMVPAEADDKQARKLFKTAFGDGLNRILIDDIHQSNARIVYQADDKLIGFLKRTYPFLTIRSDYGVLCNYFYHFGARGNGPRIIAVLEDENVVILALENNRLLSATSLKSTELQNVCYHMLATRQVLELPETTPFIIASEATRSAALMMQLRRFSDKVMPAVFPGELHNMGVAAHKLPLSLVATFLKS